MQFSCYADWDQLPESADALFSMAEKESVFFSRPWFENLVGNALQESQSMILACVIDNERVLAMLPLMKSDNGQWQSLGHLYTSLYTLLLAQNVGESVLKCLAEGLYKLNVYTLRLDPVADNDSNMQSLEQAMEASGYSCHRYFRFYNWIHRLQGQTYHDYMAARPARVRNTIARKRRKLEREHGYRIRLYTDHNQQQGIADYNAVYQASWKSKELFAGFIEGLAEKLSSQGWLRLAVLYIEEKPAAAQFWFVTHGKASIFKLVYDEAWKEYSPGSILTGYLMKHVIDTDKVEEIDFLTGNDAYKQDWMSERRERWGLYCGITHQSDKRTSPFFASLKNWTGRLRKRFRYRQVPPE